MSGSALDFRKYRGRFEGQDDQPSITHWSRPLAHHASNRRRPSPLDDVGRVAGRGNSGRMPIPHKPAYWSRTRIHGFASYAAEGSGATGERENVIHHWSTTSSISWVGNSPRGGNSRCHCSIRSRAVRRQCWPR